MRDHGISKQLFQTIDDVDIREINVAYLRQQMGLVSQEPILFDYSIEGQHRSHLSRGVLLSDLRPQGGVRPRF